MHNPRTLRTVAVALVAGALLTSCSTTILDSINTTTTSSVVTTTTIPTGDVIALLSGMQKSVGGLGDAIVNKDREHTTEALSSVESTWIALQPQLEELDRQHGVKPIDTGLVDDVQRIVNLVRSAVGKRRPADADKASRFIPLVIDALK